MKRKVDYRTVSPTTYRRFCSTHPDISISKKEWAGVVKSFNCSVRDYILETGEKVKLPHGVGILSVSKFKPKKTKVHDGKEYINLPIDWVKTKAAGKRIYNFNSHTDGFKYKWYWFRQHTRIHSSNIRFFKPTRIASRKLAALLKMPNSKYIELYKMISMKFPNLTAQRESKER